MAILDAPLHSPLLRWSQPWLMSTRQGVALLQPNHCPMQPVLHCVCGIPCSSPCFATAPLHTVHAMVPASAQSTHLHRTRPCVHSLSHMPTQAVANPPKPLGLLRRPADSGSRRSRSTICGNTRCTFAFTVVAMVAALVDEHETRPSPSYSQTTAQCSQCCTVCVVSHAVALALPLLPCILCTLWCLQVPNRPTCTAPDHVSIA